MPLAPFYVPLVFDYLHYKHCCCFITAPSCWGWGCIHLFGQTEISFSFSFFFFFFFLYLLGMQNGNMQTRLSRVEPKISPRLQWLQRLTKKSAPNPSEISDSCLCCPPTQIWPGPPRGASISRCELPMRKSLLKNPLGRALKKNLLLRASSEEQICSSYLFKAISSTPSHPHQ